MPGTTFTDHERDGYDAIVLAGGRSSRMGGVDKVGIVIDGETLLGRACAAVRGARQLVIVGPAGLAGMPAGAVCVREDPPFSGPAAAIGAGFAALGDDVAPLVVIVAADVPEAAMAVSALLPAAQTSVDGVIARSSDGYRQPLLAVYRSGALGVALASHEPLVDLSANRLISAMSLTELDLPDSVIADVDTPADLRRLTEEIHDG